MFTFSWADTWSDAVVRELCMSSDRLVDALLHHPDVARVLVADPFRSWPVRQARRLLGHRQAELPALPGRARMAPLRLRRRPPARVAAAVRLYRAYDRRLARAATAASLERPAVITVNPFVAAFSPLAWAGPVTYYALDDWAAHPRHRRLWPVLEHAHAAIRERGVGVCCVSRPLLERLAPTGPHLVVPNGVAPAEWRPPWSPPPWYGELPRPRMLYVGTIDDRLDVDSLVATATRHPGGTLVLVGLVTDPAAVARLGALPNVRIRAPVGRRAVAGMVHTAEVCLLPHRRTRLTDSMSPLKLFEYLAGGAPVVATDLPPLRDLAPGLRLAAPGAAFAEAVSEAIGAGPVSEAERRAAVAAHSWSGRHRDLLAFALGTQA